MSGFEAAMDLAVLAHIKKMFEERKKVVDYFNKSLNFSHLTKIVIREGTNWNYSYYPVIFESEIKFLKYRNY